MSPWNVFVSLWSGRRVGISHVRIECLGVIEPRVATVEILEMVVRFEGLVNFGFNLLWQGVR